MAHEILIYGTIGDMGWWDEDHVTAKDVAEQLASIPQSESEVELRVNSVGGYTTEGIAIMNQLRSFAQKRRVLNGSFRINGYVDAAAYSAASVVILGADTLTMMGGSRIMIHSPWIFAAGNAKELRETADRLDDSRDVIAKLYADKTKHKIEEIVTLLEDETWFNAEEAVAFGLADKVDDKPADFSCYGQSAPFLQKVSDSTSYREWIKDHRDAAMRRASKDKSADSPTGPSIRSAVERDLDVLEALISLDS